MTAHIIVIASWYPGADDPGRGRFVADQAEALHSAERVRPLVVTFDPAPIGPELLKRPGDVALVDDNLLAALSSGRGDMLSPRALGSVVGVPVARLPIADGPDEVLGSGRQGDVRREALMRLAGHLGPPPGPTVVHAHTGYPDGYAAAGMAAALSVPLVITEHASYVTRQLRNPEQRRRYHEAAEAAARFIAVGEDLAEQLRAWIPSLAAKLEVVPNVVPLEQFAHVGEETRRDDELLFVGYRKERKGMPTLLHAFAELCRRRPSATLRLVGRSTTDEEEARWHQMADELGIGGAVSFEAPQDRAGVAAAMARASLFVHPSPRETFGVTTLEALASALPVVATRSGGVSSILADPRLGDLVPVDDPAALADALLRALERRSTFEPDVLREAVRPYSAPVVAGRLADLYQSVLGGAPPPVARPAPRSAIGWEGEARAFEHVVVCGLDGDRAAAALGMLSRDLVARVVLLTNRASPALATSGVLQVIATGSLIERALRDAGLHGPRGGPVQRVTRTLLNPRAALRRRRALRSPEGLAGYRRAVTRDAISDALRRAGALRAGAPDVVCLAGEDHALVAPLVADGGLRPAPGGILWLADRWWSLNSVPEAPREPVR